MASHESALKRHRRDEKARLRNRAHRSCLRTQVTKCRKAIAEGDADAVRGILRSTLSLIDRTAKLGVIHGNAASRTKSRLTRAFNRLDARA